MTAFILATFNTNVQRNRASLPRAFNNPGRVIAEPLIRPFLLVTVIDLLFKETELIIDSKSIGRYTQGRERFHEASRQASESTIPEWCIGLGIHDLGEIKTHRLRRLLSLL